MAFFAAQPYISQYFCTDSFCGCCAAVSYTHLDVYKRQAKILNKVKKAMNGSKVLVLGVAYKQDIDDYRESPALKVIDVLEREGAEVTFFDPWVKEYKHNGQTRQSISALTEEVLKEADLVMITTAHTNIDYDMVQKNAALIFDTKNAMKNIANRENIEVL